MIVMAGKERMLERVLGWFDSSRHIASQSDAIDWVRIVPFLLLHVGMISLVWVGFSSTAVAVAIGSYCIRMFAITAVYHRYFAHKTYSMGRKMQFGLAFLGATATQRGPLWWAAHHRAHHRHSDTTSDPHDASRSWWWVQVGWFLSKRHFRAPPNVPEWEKFPELMWLDRFDWFAPVCYALAIFALGEFLSGYGTSGWQTFVWGYVVSTVFLIHVTSFVNSVCHKMGGRRFNTRDSSRNCWWVAILTFGEGWHNNHHRYAGSVRQGFYWWEVDFSYYILRILRWFRLVDNLRVVPQAVIEEGRQ